MNRSILKLFWLMLILILPAFEVYGSVLSDPGIPDGEQIVWQVTKEGNKSTPSIITWKTGNLDGRPIYQVTTDTGKEKQATYIIDRSDMRLIEAKVFRNHEDGKSEVTIEAKGGNQYLVCKEEGEKPKDREIDRPHDGYDGTILPFCLRGYPFEKRKEVEMKITPPFKPGVPFWAWRMWKSHARFLGTEKVTVPAGTFDCYKLKVGASGGFIKRFTSGYYFWFSKKPPYQFVKYQDEDGDNVTELIEIRGQGESQKARE